MSEAGYVYLAASPLGPTKIGFSADPETRIGQLARRGHRPSLLLTIPTEDGRNLESALHDFFVDRRIRGEWFWLTEAEIDALRRGEPILEEDAGPFPEIDKDVLQPKLPPIRRAGYTPMFTRIPASIRRRIDRLAENSERALNVEVARAIREYCDREEKKAGLPPIEEAGGDTNT